MKYKRVLVKISGEALSGKGPLDVKKLDYITEEIISLHEKGVEIVLIIGGGNISRGDLGEKWGISHVESDINGMMSTLVNAGWIGSIIGAKKEDSVRNMVSIASSYLGEMYSPAKAISYLKDGKIVIIGGGNGIALCSTDSAAIQRAIELDTDCVIMLKNGVDGVYEEDPKKNPLAKRYEFISFKDLKKMEAKVMDETAAVTAAKYKMPIYVCNFNESGGLIKICEGTNMGTYIGEVSTKFY